MTGPREPDRASGIFATPQGFDLALILTGAVPAMVGGSGALNGGDVTPALLACVVPGTLATGGVTLRCQGLSAGLLGIGTNTFAVTVRFADGTSVSRTVGWVVLAASGP